MREILVMTSPTSARTDCRGEGGEALQPLRTGVFKQFPWREIMWQRCIWQPRIINLVTSNGIKSRKEHEIQAKKSSREAEEGEEEKISMKINVNLREIEQETEHLL